jgi:hypothetical protein
MHVASCRVVPVVLCGAALLRAVTCGRLRSLYRAAAGRGVWASLDEAPYSTVQRTAVVEDSADASGRMPRAYQVHLALCVRRVGLVDVYVELC